MQHGKVLFRCADQIYYVTGKISGGSKTAISAGYAGCNAYAGSGTCECDPYVIGRV